MHDERLTLATICGGALQEKVDRALEKVAKNILDPNTEPGKKRTITLKITLKPNEADAEDVKVSAEVSYTLAPETGVATQFFVNKDLENDSVTVMEHKRGEIRGQLDFSDIGFDPEGKVNVRTVRKTENETPDRDQADFDPETGEVREAAGEPINFRKEHRA